MTEGLDDSQIRALLAVAASYDNRNLTESAVAAWTEASRVGRWDFVTARDAIVWHSTNDPEYLKPAHITRYIRARRQQPQHLHAQRQIEAPDPAGKARIDAILAELARRLRWNRGITQSRRDPALRVPCPHQPCRAGIGVPCAVPISHGPHKGETRQLSKPHPSRTEAAESYHPARQQPEETP